VAPAPATARADLTASREHAEDDTRLVERARAGDRDAYGALVERYGSVAFRTAYLLCGNEADAEDATQEAFVKGWRALGRFRAGAPVRPWLLRIVANEAHNRRRQAGRRGRLALRASAEAGREGSAPSPEAALLGAEERDRLLAALAALDERDRQAIGCRYFLGLDEQEMAAALRVRPGTVKSRLARALERLREQLGEVEA
jgi:RNA polymerase sigma factor (sigma-70 family)